MEIRSLADFCTDSGLIEKLTSLPGPLFVSGYKENCIKSLLGQKKNTQHLYLVLNDKLLRLGNTFRQKTSLYFASNHVINSNKNAMICFVHQFWFFVDNQWKIKTKFTYTRWQLAGRSQCSRIGKQLNWLYILSSK